MKNRISRLSRGLLIVVCLLSGPVIAAAEVGPNFHGMLVLGTRGEIWMLHLAMRDVPDHMSQLILRVELEASSRTRIDDRTFVGEAATLDTLSPNQVYFLDRNHEQNDVAVYTFDPGEAFVLTEIPEGKRLTFRGDVVRGHFERDRNAPVILRDVIVSVEEIAFYQDLQELDSEAPHPLAAEKWQFLLFGSGGEHFLSHRISLHGAVGEDDNNAFHQVFPVSAAVSRRLHFESARTVAMEIDGAETALLPADGGTFEGMLQELVEGTSVPLTLELGPEHYFEELMAVGTP